MSDLDLVGGESSPERFDPEHEPGGLMEAEHRARYWWAAQWVAGKRVLDAGCGIGYGMAMLAAESPASLVGVDIADEALARARDELGEDVELVRADVRDLPFDSQTVDVVVCFEVIEHVDRQADALSELKRVLRPDGTLLISSPNRDVYTPGNPHHVHELVPEELRDELAAHFQHVVLYRQHPWLASALLRDDELSAAGLGRVLTARTGDALEPGQETYTLAVASDVPPRGNGGIVVLNHDFEVRWWHEQLDGARQAQHRSAREASALRQELGRLSSSLLETEQTAAKALDLQHRLDELESEFGREHVRLAHSERVIDDMKASISWRITAPLRAAKSVLSRRGDS
jgi:SAM-dependent methyltransferase